MSQNSTLQVCAVIITTLMVFTILRLGAGLFAPMLLALVLGVVLSPLSDISDRLGAPAALSAFLTLIVSLFAILTVALLLEPHVTYAIQQAPMIWSELRETLQQFQVMLRGLEELSSTVTDAIDMPDEGDSGSGVTVPSLTDAVFAAPQYAAQVMVFIGTLYFFLLARRDVYKSANNVFGRIKETNLLFAEAQVARYFLTITVINASFGLLVGLVMAVIGLPSPVLWGILAFLVNFVLYLGPAALAATLLVAGIASFDGAISFLPAAAYLTMNATEGQFVTPSLVGKSMSVNPLLVFLSLVFWLWLWGPIGGFIAIPVLIWISIMAKSISAPTKPPATSNQT